MKTTVADQKQIHGEPSQKTNAKGVIDFRPFARPRQHRSVVYWYKRMKAGLLNGQDPSAWSETWELIKTELLVKKQEYSSIHSYAHFRNLARQFSKLPETESGLIASMLYELSRHDDNVVISNLPTSNDFMDSFNSEKK